MTDKVAKPEEDDLEQMATQVRRIIEENRKFLQRVLDEDFEPEDEAEGEDEEPEPEEL